ncbi:hypothetical protein RIF29_28858 [Crotalaria pallida]|uniref:SAWADEE domain-containing protein n=1 Tax=Crotalaria pallida TaxID=3830 RepID=A0AAN9EDX1_CROPI
MDKLSLIESASHQFSIDEEMGEKSLDQNFCQKIAKNFSSSSESAGKSSLSWEQVQHWFQNKQKELQANVTLSPDPLKVVVNDSDASMLRNGHNSFATPKGKPATDLNKLKFEARSFKDLAWHDVSSFLNFRVMSTGELEVRIRYAGFGKDEDEWVNVKDGVREASIPLEPSDCHKVKDGDLVLCFVVRDDYALYCDAHVVNIQREEHGPADCKCLFTVRYLHDDSEAAISWKDVCCRPSQEKKRPLALPMQSIESLWG